MILRHIPLLHEKYVHILEMVLIYSDYVTEMKMMNAITNATHSLILVQVGAHMYIFIYIYIFIYRKLA